WRVATRCGITAGLRRRIAWVRSASGETTHAPGLRHASAFRMRTGRGLPARTGSEADAWTRALRCDTCRPPCPPDPSPRSRGGRSLLLYFRATGIAPRLHVARVSGAHPGAATDARMKEPGRSGRTGQNRATYRVR